MRFVPIVRASMTAALVLAGSSAFAQAPDAGPQQLREAIDQLKADFETRLAALEARLAAVESAAAGRQEAPPAVAPVPATQGGIPVSSSNVFNPDIAVFGNFLGAAGENQASPMPALQLQESEVSLQAVVDPYARGDFYLAFGEEGVEIEEGYMTLTALPGGLLAKVGKMRSAFGKVNTLHNHTMPWTDRPLVIDNLAGGEEGISDAGLSVAKLLPNPWMFLEATGQVFHGTAGEGVFESSTRGDLLYVGHLRAYRDLAESSNLDFGFSYAYGHNPSGIVDGEDTGRFTTSLYGFDATFRWKPLTRSIYRSFLGRGEWIRSDRRQFEGTRKADGFYISGDYQFARRWTAGGRFDRSKRAADASVIDDGASALLTFRPSEFSLVRGQYRRTRYAQSTSANEVLFQFLFAIGAHGAHPF